MRRDAVAAAFDRELHDVVGIEVDRVRREARARGVLDALVDGQDRDVAGAAEAAVPKSVCRLRKTVGVRSESIQTRSRKSGPGSVQQVLGNRLAGVAQHRIGVAAQQLLNLPEHRVSPPSFEVGGASRGVLHAFGHASSQGSFLGDGWGSRPGPLLLGR